MDSIQRVIYDNQELKTFIIKNLFTTIERTTILNRKYNSVGSLSTFIFTLFPFTR